jgi:hypothetical protein
MSKRKLVTQHDKAILSLNGPDRAAILNPISMSPTYFESLC